MRLSEQQNRAARHKDGPALVLSVPGSGKTTVLLERIRRLQEHGVHPKNILTVTFSRVQADDMRRRFGNADGVTFYTIHSFCYQLIRGWLKAKNRQMTVIESGSSFTKYDLVRRLCRARFHRPMQKEEVEEFFRFTGYIKNTMTEDLSSYEDFYRLLYADYEESKREHHFLDFDDMLSLCLHILATEEEWLARLRARFPYIQLDEGQDTSAVQMEILRTLAEPANNFFVVADDDQSIYAFRGADPEALLRFSAWYENPALYYLEENFRSAPQILESASRVIQNNTARYAKTMKAVKEEREPVLHKIVPNLRRQLTYLVKEVKKYPEKSTAILYRNRLSGLPVASILTQEGLPYTVRHPWEDLLSHPVCRDIFTFYHLAEHPLDAEAFLSIYYKVGAFISKEQALMAAETGDHKSIWDALAQQPDLPAWRADQLRGLAKKWRRLRRMPFSARLDFIENELDYGGYLQEWTRRQAFSTNTAQIMDILKATLRHAQDRESWAALLTPPGGVDDAHLVLSTLHGSKGLEYDRVYMIDLIQNEFPGNLGEKKEERAQLEEERRLFYVGMTRAKEKLTLLSLSHRNERSCEPSQFIQEIKR